MAACAFLAGSDFDIGDDKVPWVPLGLDLQEVGPFGYLVANFIAQAQPVASVGG